MRLFEADEPPEGEWSEVRQHGFTPDDDWYHGTSKPIERFDPSHLGSTTAAPQHGIGVLLHLGRASRGILARSLNCKYFLKHGSSDAMITTRLVEEMPNVTKLGGMTGRHSKLPVRV
jgi:hypothetical protein